MHCLVRWFSFPLLQCWFFLNGFSWCQTVVFALNFVEMTSECFDFCDVYLLVKSCFSRSLIAVITCNYTEEASLFLTIFEIQTQQWLQFVRIISFIAGDVTWLSLSQDTVVCLSRFKDKARDSNFVRSAMARAKPRTHFFRVWLGLSQGPH